MTGEPVIRAYAKPLLTALVLHVLCSKLEHAASRAVAPALPGSDHDAVEKGIRVLRDKIATEAGKDYAETIQGMADTVAAAMHLFRTGRLPTSSPRQYWPITGTPLYQVAADAEIPTGGLPEMAISLGLLGLGESSGLWSVTASPSHGVISVTATATGVHARVLFAATARADIALEQSGVVDSADDDIVVIHSDRVASPMTRSPSAPPGRAGLTGPRHVGMAEILLDADSADTLRMRFREEAGL
jgi:hypothetical protein